MKLRTKIQSMMVMCSLLFTAGSFVEAKGDAPDVEDYASYFSKQPKSNASASVQKKADNLRLRTITSISKLLNSKKINKYRKFELYLRLGETYAERHDYLRGLEIEDFTKRYDKWVRKGEKGKAPVANYSKSRNELTKAANSFRKLVNQFPKHPRTDAALFALAKTLLRLGNDNAVNYYNRLITSYPKSKLIPETYLALGEHYFEKHQISLAIQNYKKAMKFKNNKAYPFAVYKLGWSNFNADSKNQKQYNKNMKLAVAAFKLVIKLSKLPKFKGNNTLALRNEAMNDLIVVWAETEDINSAWSYFQKINEKSKFYTLLEKLGSIYAEQGKNQKAINVYTRLLKEAPLRENNPNIYIQVAELHDLTSRPDKVVLDFKNMINLYVSSKTWSRYNLKKAKDKRIVADSLAKIQKQTQKFATSYHSIGQKSNSKAHKTAAMNLYNIYLAAYPKSPEAYELRYYLAELLMDFKQYSKAADEYVTVSKYKTKNPKYKNKAALQAVVAMNSLVKATKYKKLPARGQVKKPMKIPESKIKLVRVIDNYLRILPKSKDAHPMMVTAAEVFFTYGHYNIAIPRYYKITQTIPGTKQANGAIKVILAYFVDKQQWQASVEWSKTFLKQKTKLNKKLNKFVRDTLRSSIFKYALVLEKQNKRLLAAKTFESFQKEYPNDVSADKALYNAGINYYKLADIDSSLRVSKLILKKYPKSKLRKDVIASIAQTNESLAYFDEASKYYKQLATEFPKDKRSPDALFNSGILYKGLKKLSQSEAVFKQFLAQYKKNKLATDALYELATIQEQRKKYKDAAKSYNKFALKTRDTEKKYFAKAKNAELTLTKVNYGKGLKLLKSLKKDLQKNKRNLFEARRIIASLSFNELDRDFKKYKKIKLNNGRKIEKQAQKKNSALISLAKKYQDVIAIGSNEFTVVSFYRMGEMNEDLANALFAAPAPKGSSQADADRFHSELEKIAFPLKKEALNFFTEAYKRSQNVETFTVWTKKAQEKMVELRPTEYKKIDVDNVEPKYLSHKFILSQDVSNLAK